MEIVEWLILIFLGLVLIGIGIVIFLLIKRKEESRPESLMMIKEDINFLNQSIQGQFGEHIKIIRDVSEKLGRIGEVNKQVMDFAEQLRELQNVLKNPKQRGVLGEYYLETVLKNVLPPGSYKMQYSFQDGSIVDAVVFIDKRIIPIDSKFSLENYNRLIEAKDPLEKKKYESAFIADLKKRIEETSKYVKPSENTMDFAFMFIPSEALFYDLLVNKIGMGGENNNLIYYASQKRVVIVSPTSFLAYLQTVLQGLRNQKISEQAQEIIKQVERLSKHLWAYSEYLERLGNHLGTTVNFYKKAYKEFNKIDKDVVKITGQESQLKLEEPEIDSPLSRE